jgi:hypothetical protein
MDADNTTTAPSFDMTHLLDGEMVARKGRGGNCSHG